jgi:hypothetical protein
MQVISSKAGFTSGGGSRPAALVQDDPAQRDRFVYGGEQRAVLLFRLAQGVFGAGALDRRPRAFRRLLDQPDLAGRPISRRILVYAQRGDETATLYQRHADPGTDRDFGVARLLAVGQVGRCYDVRRDDRVLAEHASATEPEVGHSEPAREGGHAVGEAGRDRGERQIPLFRDLGVHHAACAEVLAQHAGGLGLDLDRVYERALRIDEGDPESVELGGAAQRLVSPLALGDVAHGGDEPAHVRVVEEACERPFHPAPRPVFVPDPILELQTQTRAAREPGQGLRATGAVIRVDRIEGVALHELFRRVTGDVPGGGAGVENPSLAVAYGDHVRDVPE